MRHRNIASALTLLTFLLLSGCDSERLQQFSSLAAAGSAYSAAFPAFSAQLGSAYITINNDQAIITHAIPVDAETAKAQILRQDADLKAYLTTLDKLNAQATILGAYFNAMGQLAGSNPSDQIVSSADGLVQQLSAANDALGKSKISSLPDAKTINDLAGPVINIVVAHFQVKALNRHLEEHAQVVNRALALQEKAIDAMTKQLSSALVGDDQFRETKQVVSPYLAKDLPESWAADRTAYIQSSVTLQSTDAAKNAITELRSTFQDVVANNSSPLDFNGLLDAIGAMAAYANSVKAALTSAT
jgi:hypothetical protein